MRMPRTSSFSVRDILDLPRPKETEKRGAYDSNNELFFRNYYFLGEHRAENGPNKVTSSGATEPPSTLATSIREEEGHSPPSSWPSPHHPGQGWPFLPHQGLGGIKQEAGSPPPPLGHHHHGHLPDLLSLPHPLNQLPKISSEEELEYDCEDGIEEDEEGVEVEKMPGFLMI